MINRKASAFLMGLFLVFCTSVSVMADDTEIYDGTNNLQSAPPLIMFTIDYSPSVLNSTVNCTASICTTLVDNGFLADDDGDPSNGAVTTRFGMLIAALKYVINSLSDVKIGLMMSHATHTGATCAGSTSGCSGGGYVLMGFTQIGTGTWNKSSGNWSDAGKQTFFDKLDALYTLASASDGSDAHTFQGKEVFYEFFRYLTGHQVYSGHLGWEDFGTDSTANLVTDNPDVMRDVSIEGITLSGSAADKATAYNSPGIYTSPLTKDCQKAFTLNFLKGVSNQEDDADTDIRTGSKADGAMENIALTGKNNNLESVLAYLNGTDFSPDDNAAAATEFWGYDNAHRPKDEDAATDDYSLLGKQNVTSYFFVDSSGLLTGHSWAKAGGTPAAIEWGDDPEKIIDAIEATLAQILSTSTTFTAASVPVSVLNRAQIVDNVYIALFKSDDQGYPRWPGNVKRLKLDTDTGVLVDQNGDNAINPNDGRIANTALTFWTEAGYLPAADTNNDEVDGKDGRAVQRGGAGQQIPGFSNSKGFTIGSTSSASTRKMYYDKSTLGNGDALSNAPLDIDTAGAEAEVQTALGVSGDATAAKILLRYVRGFDVSTNVNNESSARSWIMGDPLHSRPLPINYGDTTDDGVDNPDIRLVFGSNDGLFHMIQNSVTNSATPYGVENWAFMPRSVMGIVDTLKTNTGTHPYGVDGAPSAYILDANNDGVIASADSDKAWVFFGLRRGGQSYYGLDVTDPGTPKFKWSISATGDFANMGYTFSQPRVGKMDWGSGETEVVIFAGGYDMVKDDKGSRANSDSDTMGNAFYIVNANDGSLVWKVEKGTTGNVSSTQYNHSLMTDSIPSTVSAVDTDGDGLIDRAYVGDTGGQVWRFDMIGTDRTNWQANVIASVGYRDSSDSGNDRRFFHRPDFIQYKDSSGDYDAVVIASGNRANPTADKVNVNYLYVIKDRQTTGLSTMSAISHKDTSATGFYDVTDNCLQELAITGTDSCSLAEADRNAQLENGWKFQFQESGEKSLATPTTLAKKIFVTTYIPDVNTGTNTETCTPPEGVGRLYALSLDYGFAVNDYDVTNGDTISTSDRYTELDSGGIPAEVVYVPFNRILKPDLSIENVGVSGRWKTYWYKEEN